MTRRMLAAASSLALLTGMPVHAADGPPSAYAAPALSVFGNLPGVEDMSMSPDGKTQAVITTINGVRQVVLIDESRKAHVAYPIGDAKLRGIDGPVPRSPSP